MPSPRNDAPDPAAPNASGAPAACRLVLTWQRVERDGWRPASFPVAPPPPGTGLAWALDDRAARLATVPAVRTLRGLGAGMQEAVRRYNRRLAAAGQCLLPAGEGVLMLLRGTQDGPRTMLDALLLLAPVVPALTASHWPGAPARHVVPQDGEESCGMPLGGMQECPRADIAAAGLVGAVVLELARGGLSSHVCQSLVPRGALARIAAAVAREGALAVIDDEDFLRALRVSGPLGAGALWRALAAHPPVAARLAAQGLAGDCAALLSAGTLAARLARAVGPAPSPQRLAALRATLAACLHDGRTFVPGDGG